MPLSMQPTPRYTGEIKKFLTTQYLVKHGVVLIEVE